MTAQRTIQPNISAKKTGGAARKRNGKKIAATVIVQALLILFSVTFLFPLLWMVSVSLQNETEMMQSVGFFDQLIPNRFLVRNFIDVFHAVPFMRYFINSLAVTSLTVVGTVLSSTLVAYAFAKLRFPGRRACITIMLATMIIPGFILLVPTFKMYSRLGLIDTWFPLILPAVMGGGAGNIYLALQFFQTVPADLSEAAKIDGAGHVRIWWQIMLPLCKPVIATLAIFGFLFSWNDFMNPLIYINNSDMYTIALGLRAFQSQSGVRWEYLMAGSLISMLPVLMVFIFCQRYFVEGIKMSGIKS